MEREFIPYEQALELKELGFDENYIACYSSDGKLYSNELWKYKDGIKAPLYRQAFRWFREKHKIISVIDFHCDGDNWEDVVHEVRISEFEHFKTHDSFVESEYKTYEEAELACLKKLIEIVKNK